MADTLQIVFQTLRSFILLGFLGFLAFKVGQLSRILMTKFTPGWEEKSFIQRLKDARRKRKQQAEEATEHQEESLLPKDQEHESEECGLPEADTRQDKDIQGGGDK